MCSVAENEPGKTPPTEPAPNSVRRLWQRYLKARGAKVGLALISIFALVAFFAPFLAHRLPYYWHDNATGATTYPLLRDFLSPTDTSEPLLEKGINFLFIFLPLSLVTWKVLNRYAPALAKRESRVVSLLFGALFSAAVWLSLGGMVVQGGGKDWLYYENSPVPNMDDIADVTALTAPGAGPLAEKVRRKARERDLALEENPAADMERQRRQLIAPLQRLIDGPLLLTIAEATAEPSMNTLGITEADIGFGINAARLNRLAVESAFPGLLTPMRQFRSAFLAVAIITFLVLLGLAYIFMAGANQFSLSPRWLFLIILGIIVALPFQATPRYDPIQYRQLAAEGKGSGLFPPIPYGTKEQGFGERLPPSWHVLSPYVDISNIRSWDQLEKGLTKPSSQAGKRVAELLGAALPELRNMFGDDTGRSEILFALNNIIRGDELYDERTFISLVNDEKLAPYLGIIRVGKELTSAQKGRLNRLLLEGSLPGAFNPVMHARWKKPTSQPGTHLIGTDVLERDVLVRIIHGARVSLSVGFVSMFLATVIGLVMGSLAAYYGGWVDMAISRFIEIMMCFPSFFLILAVIAILDKRSIVNIMLVIGLTSWTGMARLVRGEMLRQKKMDYVAASIALGASDTRIIFRHILPNAMAPVLVSISFGITGAILTEAGLSFIGLGVTPPTPTWGQLLSDARDSPFTNWWLAVFPGVVLFLSVVGFNLVGEGLRDALDPRTSL